VSIELLRAEWPAPEGVVAGCTTRSGGVSSGTYASLNLGDHVGDREADVAENRRRLVAAAALPAEPSWLRQVHGAGVAVLEPGTSAMPEADASVSLDGRSTLGILTADCLPVLLCSVSGASTAALHCGWRSLSAGIVAQTVARIRDDCGDLLAWMGPAISQAAFEVGDEVRDSFLAGVEDAAACFVPNENGRWQADLYGLARRFLQAAGVHRIYGGNGCTYAQGERYFSYRRDGQTGRMASYIARR